jgi:NADH:ubiquinone oxidoreductase subunit 2 (subunit N)
MAARSVNSVIALFYYANVAKAMWFEEPVDGDVTPIRVPFSLATGVALTVAATLAFGVFPGLIGHFTDFPGTLALGG